MNKNLVSPQRRKGRKEGKFLLSAEKAESKILLLAISAS
jgi:hypothetical protein